MGVVLDDRLLQAVILRPIRPPYRIHYPESYCTINLSSSLGINTTVDIKLPHECISVIMSNKYESGRLYSLHSFALFLMSEDSQEDIRLGKRAERGRLNRFPFFCGRSDPKPPTPEGGL